MKVRVYMRVARNVPGGRTMVKVDASPTPKARPLITGQGLDARELHTLHFALVLDVPDELFKPADWPVVEVALDPTIVARVPVTATPELPAGTVDGPPDMG